MKLPLSFTLAMLAQVGVGCSTKHYIPVTVTAIGGGRDDRVSQDKHTIREAGRDVQHAKSYYGFNFCHAEQCVRLVQLLETYSSLMFGT